MTETFSYRCITFYRSFVAYTSHRLQELGLSFGVLFLLVYVGKHPDCTQGELTQALELDWGYCQRSVVQLVEDVEALYREYRALGGNGAVVKLVEDGFLLRERKGRAYHLDLSEKGREAFELSHQFFSDWDEQVLGALGEEEREQLFTLLDKVKTKEGISDPCTRPF